MSFLAATAICLAAMLVAAMVLMSGFGLGTLLTPLFVVFYDIKIAVFLVAIVHFSNNLFKLGLFFRHLDRAVLKRFGALSVGVFRRVVAGTVVAVGIAMAVALI